MVLYSKLKRKKLKKRITLTMSQNTENEFTKNDKRYLYAYDFNEEYKRCSQIDIRIYEDGQWEDKTEYNDWTYEEIELYNNSKYGEVMGQINREIHCIDCDYTIDEYRFYKGYGRIMFSDVGGETEYRCGVCDDRCSDPYGMFPDTDDDDEEEEEEELKCIGFRPQTRMGECEGCKMICEECERLMIVEETNDEN